MNLRQLNVFVKVVEEGSFAAAARALGLPRSGVSQAVAGLEAELGVRLLHRSTRAMTLTDAGAQLHAGTAPALLKIAETAATVSDRQGPIQGRVRLTAPVEVGARLLEPVLSRFLLDEPGVRVDLLLTTRTLDLVENRIDLAIRGGPVRDPGLVARRLGAPQSGGLFASPSYLARRGTPRRVQQLAQHDAIAVQGPQCGWRLRGPHGVTEVQVPVRLEVDAWGYATRAACSGVGIAVLPSFLCEEECRRGLLVRVLPAYSIEERPIWLVYSSARNLSRAVVALRDALRAAFPLRRLFVPPSGDPPFPGGLPSLAPKETSRRDLWHCHPVSRPPDPLPSRGARSLLREPMIHFFFAGALLFGIERVAPRKPSQESPPPPLTCPSASAAVPAPATSLGALRKEASEAFTKTFGRPPEARDLDRAVASWLDEEALFREGLRLGLEQDDPGIRQRVASKARAVLLAQQLLPEPTEAELKAHHAAHRQRWERPALVDFVQVFVKGDDPEAKARAGSLLQKLREGGDPSGLGDSFPGGRRYRKRSLEDLRSAFGEPFVAGMAETPEKEWSLRSSRFGLHLIRIEKRSPAEAPTFAEVRDEVAADLHTERRDAALSTALKALRARHGVPLVP